MRRRLAERGKVSFGCILWLVVVAMLAHVLWKVVPVKVKTSEFYDAMEEQARFGSIKGVPAIEYEILRRAEQLQVPVTKDNLKIIKRREHIQIEAHYQITLEFFNGLYVYVWKFDPVISRPLFNV